MCGLAILTVPRLCSLSGLPGNTPVTTADVEHFFPTSSLKLLATVPLFTENHPSTSLSVYLFCINLLKQHVGNLFFWGKERDREGYPPWHVPHTQGLWEPAVCRSGLFELEWPEASPPPLGAMFQMAQPLPNK